MNGPLNVSGLFSLSGGSLNGAGTVDAYGGIADWGGVTPQIRGTTLNNHGAAALDDRVQ